MAKSILSNSTYTLHFSMNQMRDHRQLLLVGSVLTQLFDEITTPVDTLSASYTMIEVLQQLLRWIGHGQALAQQWHQLAERLQPVYDDPLKEG